MKNIRFLICKYSSYAFLFSFLFLVDRFILLQFFNLKAIVLFNKIYLYEIVLAIVNIIVLCKCVKISDIE